MTYKKLGAWALAGALSLVSSAALADVAGAPPGGAGGTTSTGGNGGGGNGGGTSTTTSTSTSTGSKDKGGCSAASPDGAKTSAALFVGLGLLFAIPAARRRRDRKRGAGRG